MPERKTLNEDLFYKGSSANPPRLHTCKNKTPFWDKSKFFASHYPSLINKSKGVIECLSSHEWRFYACFQKALTTPANSRYLRPRFIKLMCYDGNVFPLFLSLSLLNLPSILLACFAIRGKLSSLFHLILTHVLLISQIIHIS